MARKRKLFPRRNRQAVPRLVDPNPATPKIVERTEPVPANVTFKSVAQGLDDAVPPPAAASPPIDVPVHDPNQPLPDNLLEELKGKGIEQGWIPPTLLFKGRLVANLPRGVHRDLKGYEIMELVRVINDRGGNDVLQADEVERLLGWKAETFR